MSHRRCCCTAGHAALCPCTSTPDVIHANLQDTRSCGFGGAFVDTLTYSATPPAGIDPNPVTAAGWYSALQTCPTGGSYYWVGSCHDCGLGNNQRCFDLTLVYLTSPLTAVPWCSWTTPLASPDGCSPLLMTSASLNFKRYPSSTATLTA